MPFLCNFRTRSSLLFPWHRHSMPVEIEGDTLSSSSITTSSGSHTPLSARLVQCWPRTNSPPAATKKSRRMFCLLPPSGVVSILWQHDELSADGLPCQTKNSSNTQLELQLLDVTSNFCLVFTGNWASASLIFFFQVFRARTGSSPEAESSAMQREPRVIMVTRSQRF